MRTVKVNICENNGIGQPSGRVVAMEFDNCKLFFETYDLKGVSFDSKISPLLAFTFMNERYHYFQKSIWYGSMSYNLYQMSVPEALRLLNKVAFSKHFLLDTSFDSKINEIIGNGTQIKASDMGWCDNTEEVEPSIFNINQTELFPN